MPLLEFAEGVTLTSTWAIYLREDREFVDRFLANQILPHERERAFRLRVTIAHETIHFFQGVLLAIPHQISLNYLDASKELVGILSRRALTVVDIHEWRHRFNEAEAILRAEIHGVSTSSLLEAHATVGSFHAVNPEGSAQDLNRFLDDSFGPRFGSVYRYAIDVVDEHLGTEAALRLTTRICALALESNSPAAAFWCYVDKIERQLGNRISKLTSRDILRLCRLKAEDTFLARYNQVPSQSRHPILHAHMQLMHAAYRTDQLVEIIGSPGGSLSGQAKESLFEAPFLCADGGVWPRGLASSWPPSETFAHTMSAAIYSVWWRLVVPIDPYMCCTHRECPVYETKLCSLMPPPSASVAASDCFFHQLLGKVLNTTAQNLVQLRIRSLETPRNAP